MISLHVITTNRIESLSRLLLAAKPYFDRIRVCDGGSTDGTIEFCKKLGCEVYVKKWDDDYASRDNLLLSKAKYGEWIMVQDDDEVPSLLLLQHLRELTSQSYNLVRLPALDCLDNILACPLDKFIEETRNGADRFRKDWLFKNIPGIRFTGSPHRGFECNPGWIPHDTCYPYIHIKTTDSFVLNDCIHAFINPIGQEYSLEEAEELKYFCRKLKVSREVVPYLQYGSLETSFIEWMIKNSLCTKPISRWFWAYFYIFHPERISEFLPFVSKQLAMFLSFKKGFGRGVVSEMPLSIVLKQMLLAEGIFNVDDLNYLLGEES